MPSPSNTPSTHEISVRDLAEFVHRRGDLRGSGSFQGPDRLRQGIRGHQRLQQSRGPGYRPELPVQEVFARGPLRLKVGGRVDGVEEGLIPVIEEIKTVQAGWSGMADPVHWAQLRIYAGILHRQHGWSATTLRLVYLELDTERVTSFHEDCAAAEAEAFLAGTLDEWFSWLIPWVAWQSDRNGSTATLPFPFPEYRAGQLSMARTVYRALRDEENLFVEAPTGLGKTLSILYPAVKSFPRLKDSKIFYLTAKGSGQQAVEEAIGKLHKSGLRGRALLLSSRDKACPTFEEGRCDVRTCAFALGYYDRYKPALRELLATASSGTILNRDEVAGIGIRHQVCPYQLARDASEWVDLIVADYNYVFDPSVALTRHFQDGPARHVVLIDEAHNLVERSRNIYSATLDLNRFPAVATAAVPAGLVSPVIRLRRTLQGIFDSSSAPDGSAVEYHQGASVRTEIPAELGPRIKEVAEPLAAYLGEAGSDPSAQPWLDFYYSLLDFTRVGEWFDETYRLIVDPLEKRLRLLCLDPAPRLRETLEQIRSAVFFSATLSPLEYFIDVLGGTTGSRRATFASPFQIGQLQLKIDPIDVSFKNRLLSLSRVVASISRHLQAQPGHHLIFCPSFTYLKQVREALQQQGIAVDAQAPESSATALSELLARFNQSRRVIALAVLGGVLAEGIDLPSGLVTGVTVITVGLPALSLERDLLKTYFDRQGRPGFAYAYQFPGLQRVIQAVGRLIRSEADQGSALMIDLRFSDPWYRSRLPGWWDGPNGSTSRSPEGMDDLS